MEVYRVQRQGDADHIPHVIVDTSVYAPADVTAANPEVIGDNIQAERTAFIQNLPPENFFSGWVRLTQKLFECEIMQIDGNEKDADQNNAGQHCHSRGRAPRRDAIGNGCAAVH
jgi:hypothetical protein